MKIALLLLLFLQADAYADTPSKKDGERLEQSSRLGAVCARYRTKLNGTPVYSEPKLTSKVVAKLSSGEFVCHVGEQGDFAIVDWSLQDEINKDPRADSELKLGQKAQLVYVRLVDLWAPASTRPEHPAEQLKRRFQEMRQGSVPEDVLAPFYEIFAPGGFRPKCQAGEICKRVEEIQRELENKPKNSP